MALNSSVLENTIRKGALATFQQSFRRYSAIWPRYADRVRSTTAVERHVGVGATPSVQKFQDEIREGTINDYGYDLANETWTAGVRIFDATLKDQQNGMLDRALSRMGRKAAAAYDVRVAAVLEAGESTTAANGQNFFSTNNKNLNTSAPLDKTHLNEAIADMRKLTDDKGDLIQVIPRAIMVPAELEGTAKELLRAQVINSTSNVLAQDGLSLIVNPYLSDATDWYLLGDENPLILQDREQAKVVSIAPGSSGDTAVNWLFYSYARYQAALNDWNMIVKNKA